MLQELVRSQLLTWYCTGPAHVPPATLPTETPHYRPAELYCSYVQLSLFLNSVAFL